jgi:hypothetical protein
LVENSGLSVGKQEYGQDRVVYLGDNPLSITSVNVYIPQLVERGVNVIY